jgi:autotransporter translocation and assembly factor TamB
VIGWAALAVATAATTVMGAAGAGLRTPPGRDVVVRAAVTALNNALDGTVSVGAVGGSVTGGLDARDLLLVDRRGDTVARIPRLEMRYHWRDLFSGRIVLGELRLTDPLVSLVRDSTGRFNLEHVLRLDRPGGGGGSRALIAFRNVEILAGSVSIRTSAEAEGSGLRERRIEDLKARLLYVRLSSPLLRERPFRFDIAALSAKVSDPAIDLKDARGRVDILGDSLSLDLAPARLANTSARVRGSLRWPADTLLFNLNVAASRVSTGDLHWVMVELPAGLTGRGNAKVRSQSGDVLAVELTNLELSGAGGGGTLRGALGLVLGTGKHKTIERADLTTDHLDLEYVRPLLATLPIAGRLTGRFQGQGPEEQLSADVDWTFQDSLVAGHPASHLEGGGVISLGGPGGFTFQDFAVRAAQLDLGTVRRLIPLDLRGQVNVAGTLSGPWKQAQFSGTLRHRDGSLPATVGRGVLRVDSRRDPVGLWADLSLDSLVLEGLRPSYPVLRIGGAFAGDVKLAGYLDSLDLRAHLAGPAGELTLQGGLLFLGPRRGAHGLDLTFARLDLHRLNDTLPQTVLQGRWHSSFVFDTAAPPRARGQLELSSSLVAGTALDSLAARWAVADSVLWVDTLTLWGPQFFVAAKGGIGLGGGQQDTLRVAARTDSVGVIEPFARWLAPEWLGPGIGPLGDSSAAPPSGAVTASLTLAGSLQGLALTGRLGTASLAWGPLTLRGADLGGRWHTTERGVVALGGTADSLAWGRFRFSGVESQLRGRRDSLSWFARTRLGESGSWLAGGRVKSDSSGSVVVIDSLGVLLPSEAWFLSRGTRLVVTDRAVAFDSAALASASGAGRLAWVGRLPRLGAGDLRMSFEGVPLSDAWALLQNDPNEAAGAVSGTLALAGTAEEPVIHGQAALQNGAFRGFRAPYVDGTFDYRDRRLGAQFALWRAGQRVLGITADLPLDLALRDAPPDRKLAGPLSIRVRADSVDLAFLEAMVPVVRQMGGRLSADFGIGGTWQSPELTGSVSIAEGTATFPALGVRHESLFGRLTLTGDTIRVDTLSLKIGEGTVAIRGFVRLVDLTHPLLGLRITAQNFRVMDARDYLSFTASGNLDLRGPEYGAVLTGQGTVTRGVLYFTDLITKQVINLEDVRYADIIDTSLVRRAGLREAFENRFLDSLRVDSLVLAMGSDVWLRSSEANIQLSGQLTVGKVRDRYRLDGNLQTPRGTYRLPLTTSVTSDFTVTNGQLQYFGTPDLNAAVDIDARHVVRQRDQNITVFVHIGGTLYTPRLTLTSDLRPAIGEAQIISLLLFGSTSPGSAGNAQLLGTAMSRVAGGVAGAALGQLERSLITDLGIPLDFVQIRPGDVLSGAQGGGVLSGTEFAVGKQVTILGVPTFLTPSARICPQQNYSVLESLGLSAEMRLSRQWLFALSRDPVGPCAGLTFPGGSSLRYQWGLDLFWERVY